MLTPSGSMDYRYSRDTESRALLMFIKTYLKYILAIKSRMLFMFVK